MLSLNSPARRGTPAVERSSAMPDEDALAAERGERLSREDQ